MYTKKVGTTYSTTCILNSCITSSVDTNILSWCIFIIAKPFRRFSLVVLHKYDFKRRSVEKDLLLDAVVSSQIANIIKNL